MPVTSVRAHLRRCFTTLLVGSSLVVPATATWSIVVLDTATGEVVVAGATCIQNFNLVKPIAIVAVGKGGGATQAGSLGPAKGIMFSGFHADKTPAEIFSEIQAAYGPLSIRQFGIVGMAGPPVTFTGNNTGFAHPGVAGQSGSLRYAIQGNVLAQDEVVFAAEATLLSSTGDLAQRVMLAMETATARGGDGRCSCPDLPPCGQPTNFRRASATAFLVVTRLGDIDSPTCAVSDNNCTSGDYYGLLTEVGNFSTPDPVSVLRRKYELWREGLQGRPDHFKSETVQTAQVLKADGLDSSMVDVGLMDVDGRPLIVGGQTLLISTVEGPPVTISNITDNGDGTHSFQVTSGVQLGTTKLRVVVQDGVRDVQLQPDLEFVQATPTELFVDQHTVSSSLGALIEFEVDSPANAGLPYHLLGSVSGTVPGTPFGGLVLPLNRDRFLDFTLHAANGPVLIQTQGALDANGQATAYLDAAPEFLSPLVGNHCDLVVFQMGLGLLPSRVSNLVGFDIVP